MRFTRLLGSAAVAASIVLTCQTSAPAGETRGSYAVVIAKATQADPAWNAVAQALVEKHKGVVVAHDGDSRAGSVDNVDERVSGLEVEHAGLVDNDPITGPNADARTLILLPGRRIDLPELEPCPFRVAGDAGAPSPAVVVKELVEAGGSAVGFASGDGGGLLGGGDDDHVPPVAP